jgi:glycosyltransferase involved in cell wall biosynthesis
MNIIDYLGLIRSNVNKLTIGIDASNLRMGGGLTHLIELLREAKPYLYDIERVVVWAGRPTLDALDDSSWLDKRNLPELDKGLVQRTLWQRFNLSNAARDLGCDLLFVPGGTYSGNFHPTVTMSQNLLPFEMRELWRYGWSFRTIKFLLLRLTQSRSFRRADGVIFLTQYARKVVINIIGKLSGQNIIIPHGLNPRFNRLPKVQRAITDFDDEHPYRLLYVSNVDQYKHQWHVVEAVFALRKLGLPVVLDLVGPAYQPALKRLNKKISKLDKNRMWVNYHGAIAFNDLHQSYAKADLAVFASSCENMPNILIESMASGLPIACSELGPMPEILGNSGVYFNPEDSESITKALQKLIDSPELRAELSQASYRMAQQYSWERSASETFGFLTCIAKEKKQILYD